MTLSSSATKIEHIGTGSQDTFPYPFKIYDKDDLAVYEDGGHTGRPYTVSGVGNDNGGDVVYTASVPSNGVIVSLVREMDYVQEVDYTAYGPFPAETHEDGLDKVVMQVQQLHEIINRSVRFPIFADNVPKIVVMSFGDVVNDKILGFNSMGVLSLLATTDYTPGNDLNMDGNDILLNGGVVLGRNNEPIISGLDVAGTTVIPLIKINIDNELQPLVLLQMGGERIELTGGVIDALNDDLILRARNAAATGTIDILKVNASDQIEFLDIVKLLNGGAVNEFSIDGTLAGNSDLAIPTEKAVKTYADWKYSASRNTLSGTTHTISGIPAGITDLEIMLAGVSTDGTSPVVLRLADAGGIEITGYACGALRDTGGGIGNNTETTGFIVTALDAAANQIMGCLRLVLYDAGGDGWMATGGFFNTSVNQYHPCGGWKGLDSDIVSVTITTVGGTDAFDAGSFRIRYK
jgi:hypothetical protein